MKQTFLILGLSMVLCGAAEAETAAERGEALVEEWCRLCHQKPSATLDPDMAPPYERLVQRPGRNRAFYEQFMREDHFPMTTYRLFPAEKQDVIEYLLSLQKQ